MGGIVWLASYPKSGNTWLRAFLHNLLRNPAQPVNINELDQFAFGDSQKRWYEKIAPKPLDDMAPEALAALTPVVHRAMAEATPDSVFVKTHNMIGLNWDVPLITMEYTAGAIYVIRNPLDVCISAAHHFGIDMDGAVELLNSPTGGSAPDAVNLPQIFGSWSGHARSWLNLKANLHVVRYEDMTDKPKATFGKAARFLGLNPTPERLRKAINAASFKVLAGQEARHGFKEKSESAERFFRSGRAGEWRRVLTPDQVRALVEAHEDLMARFGYLDAARRWLDKS
ncbi:sulfotransferase domain-containing protein [Oceanibacterium hippocampi]|uniref:Sulfotransferase domain protein n=1 Tax=Oceanibacterium hippocampi TaxID=745714 RepID=A0A1Y5RLK5_9PROT|nr:sulfotransferase domain-containing protein [Oceanibacterium hippocampi]SLN20318.1 Sulfotransferase domain protein [Oceanibacterium hippocampi]